MPTLINSFSLSSVVGIGTNSPNKNLTVVGDISASKNIWTGGDLTVGGNFTTNGTATFINTNNLNINDTLIYLAASNTANLNDIGIVGHFTDTLNTGVTGYQHTGLVRHNQQGSPGTWTLFSGLTTEPASATNISWTDPTFQYDNLNVNSINSTGASTISVSSTSPALLIQQIGTGPSFKVNDTTNDTSPFVIDTAGNVGVGTATPATPLDVNGVATLRSGNYTDTGIFGVATQYLSSFRSTSACLLSGTYMSFPAVGVGGQTDTCLLRQIGGNDALILSFDLYDNPESSTGQGFAIRTIPSVAYAGTTFALSSIQTNFWVDPTGNVGIGTASPNYPLTVNGTVSASNFRAVQGVPSNVDASLNGYSFGADGDTGMFSPSGVRFGTNGAANGLVAFYSNNVEVMRLGAGSSIGGTGTTSYVGIGTSAPTQELTVVGDISATGIISAGSFSKQVQNADYTVSDIDCGSIVYMDSTANHVVNVPSGAGGCRDGFQVTIIRANTGTVTFTPTANFHQSYTLSTLSARWSAATLAYSTSYGWTLFGDLA